LVEGRSTADATPAPINTRTAFTTKRGALPRAASHFYAITDEVRYDDVEGDAFLEMWS